MLCITLQFKVLDVSSSCDRLAYLCKVSILPSTTMAMSRYPGISASLERWMWYADRELRDLRHELQQSNTRRDGDIQHLQERVAAHQQIMLGDAGLSEEVNNVSERLNEYGRRLEELHHSFTRHCRAVMGYSGILVDVEDLQSRVTHLEKELQSLHVNMDNLSTLVRQVLHELVIVRSANSDIPAIHASGSD